MIHVSELAWHRVDHPKDVLRIGEEIEVYVLSLDRTTNRIALSRKRLLPDPWSDAMNRYHEGQSVEGTVTNVVDFGAFIALDDGLEGLLHLTEMGDGTLKEPYSYVKKGDRCRCASAASSRISAESVSRSAGASSCPKKAKRKRRKPSNCPKARLRRSRHRLSCLLTATARLCTANPPMRLRIQHKRAEQT